MLTFLRKIRKSLIDSSDTQKPASPAGRYTLYAITEIALIVFGILIALQINNWNEHRNTSAKQKELLAKLVRDLESDINRNLQIDSIYRSWLVEVDYAYNTVLKGKLNKLTKPSQFVPGRGSLFYLNVRKSSYEEMINTGILYSLTNKTSDLINAYYELAQFELEKVNRDNQDFADYQLSPATKDQKLVVMRLRYQKNLDYINWNWLNDPNSGLYKHLETYCGWLTAAIEANQEVMNKLNKKAESLIKEINLALQE